MKDSLKAEMFFKIACLMKQIDCFCGIRNVLFLFILSILPYCHKHEDPVK